MQNKSFHYTAVALNILEKLLGSKFSINGLEKLPNHPVIFVANHFTRSETFFIPYLIYKHSGRYVRCLADSKVFVGKLGNFLDSVGAISTKNPNRDNIILRDLITHNCDWMIYPEGSMLKSKEVDHGNGGNKLFINHTPHRSGPVHTGSAVLALESEFYRQEIVENFEKNKSSSKEKESSEKVTSQEFSIYESDNFFDIPYQESFKHINTHIVPLTITYYPIRPGENNLQKLISYLIKEIPQQIAEELEIESNLLLDSEINIAFGDPINVGQYLQSFRNSIKQLPIIKRETKNNLILRYFKSRLTVDFMDRIYSNIQINFDHIFAASLYYLKDYEIEINHLKRVIYHSANLIAKSKRHRIHKSIFEENLVKIFCDEPHLEFDSVFDLALQQGMIAEFSQKNSNRKIAINKKTFEQKYNFHEIRQQNTLRVIVNEFLLLEDVNAIVKRVARTDNFELSKIVFTEIFKHDLENFNSDYAINFDQKFSKDKLIGSPFFLDSQVKASTKIHKTGIIIVHGYKSAPKEIEALAQFLNGFGLMVYAVRLRGHGTSPLNLKDTKWQDWYDSLQRGYAAMSNVASRIVMVGFSTGGLLSLLSCAKKNFKNRDAEKICAVVSINSALRLVDIKARMVPGINLWNELLNKLDINKGKLEYVDDSPENPAINYSRNYIKAVNELESLMGVCEENLKNISAPILIIQGKNDPIVNPISGKKIYQKISSKEKSLVEMDFANHVIVNSEGKEEVFEEIRKFLSRVSVI